MGGGSRYFILEAYLGEGNWKWREKWEALESCLFKKRFYLFIFRERGRGGRKRGTETLVASCIPPTGDLAWNSDIYLDQESNQ